MRRPKGIESGMSKVGWAVIAFGAAVSQCGHAEAQTAAGGAKRFSLDLHGRVSYESNVAGGDTSLAAARGIEPADVLYTAGASVTLSKPSTRYTLFATGTVDAVRHQKNTNLNGQDYNASVGAAGQLFGPCGASAGGSYSHHQTLTQDLTVVVTKNVTENKSANVGVSCGRSGFVGGVQTGISTTSNQAKTAGFVDSSTRTASVSLGYANTTLGDIRTFATYSKISYDNLPMVVVPGILNPRGSEQYGAGLSYSRKIGQRLAGSATLSYGTVQTAGAGGKTSNFSGDASLSYQFTRRLTFQAGYGLANRASGTINSDYVRTQTARFSGSYSLGSRVDLNAGVSYANDNYRGGNPLGVQVRKSEQITASGGVNVRVGKKISVSLDASHSDRQADLPQFDFSSDRVSLGVTSRF